MSKSNRVLPEPLDYTIRNGELALALNRLQAAIEGCNPPCKPYTVGKPCRGCGTITETGIDSDAVCESCKGVKRNA